MANAKPTPGQQDMATMHFADLAVQLLELPGPWRLIAIDGPGGAGKTTFAERLVAAAQALSNVSAVALHTDEFATPYEPTEWWPRLQAVLELLTTGQPATFDPYDWAAGGHAPSRTVDPAALVILEGVSASRIEWAHHLSFRIWVDASPQTCQARGVARDSVTCEEWDRAAAAEADFFAQDGAISRADMIVVSTEHDLDPEFSVAGQHPTRH